MFARLHVLELELISPAQSNRPEAHCISLADIAAWRHLIGYPLCYDRLVIEFIALVAETINGLRNNAR